MKTHAFAPRGVAAGAVSLLVIALGAGSSGLPGPVHAAAAPAQSQATPTRALPDFSALVEQVGPAVVNISTVRRVQAAGEQQRGLPWPEDDPFYEFFRRFGVPFGQGTPQPAQGLGSGFIISADGHILTNAHVVADAVEVTVKLTDRREFKAKVVGTDRLSDIATLKIEASDLPRVRIGDPAKVKVGDWVAAIGSPFGFENSVTSGIVSAKSRALPDSTYVPFIQTDVAVNPGNSGGPLFNMQGEVIGINSQIYSRTGGYMGLSFAIPIDVAMKVKEDLVRHGKVTRGRLGVTIQNVTQALAKSFGLKEPNGAIVSSVEKGGPADQAGLKSGDVILSVGGAKVETSNELPGLVARIEPGTRTEIGIWREGKRETLTVTVGELSEKVAASSRAPAASGGKLGLSVRPLTPAERKQAEVEGGVVVESAQGPAARAGIQAGDVILGVNGERVRNAEQLREAVENGGEVLALLVQRNDTRIYIPVKVG